MATIRINYFKPPRYRVGGKVISVVGEFISSEKLSVSGSSVTTTRNIPDGTGVFSVHGDSEFVMAVGASPTAVDDSTSQSHPAVIPFYGEYNPLSLVDEKIAVLNV